MGYGAGRCLVEDERSVIEVYRRDLVRRLDCQFKEPFDSGMGIGERVWSSAMQAFVDPRMCSSSRARRIDVVDADGMEARIYE